MVVSLSLCSVSVSIICPLMRVEWSLPLLLCVVQYMLWALVEFLLWICVPSYLVHRCSRLRVDFSFDEYKIFFLVIFDDFLVEKSILFNIRMATLACFSGLFSCFLGCSFPPCIRGFHLLSFIGLSLWTDIVQIWFCPGISWFFHDNWEPDKYKGSCSHLTIGLWMGSPC